MILDPFSKLSSEMMYSNPIQRRQSKGKMRRTMAASRPRRTRQNIVRSESSNSDSEDSIVGPPTRKNVATSIESDSEVAGPRPIGYTTRKAAQPPEGLLKSSVSALLQYRELGRSSKILGRKKIQSLIQARVFNNPLRRLGSWVGASGDVLIAAWSPDGSSYAFGCSADLDPASAQYNRRNNLLFGGLEQAKLHELPDHFVDRKEALQSPDVSTLSTLDPELYTTITSVAFDTSGEYLYTSSYDRTVKVWDVQGDQPRAINTLAHNAVVTHLICSSTWANSFVTGQSTQKSSIRIYTNHALNEPIIYFESDKAQKSKEQIYPSAMQLGAGPMAEYLLAGFAGNNLDSTTADKHGDICLWDLNKFKAITIRGNSQTVFDLSWQSHSQLFAAATKPGSGANLGNRYKTKSLIRVWQPLSIPSFVQEYECPALDINDVHFHPWDENIVVASCTDGATYVWDCRKGDQVLNKFQHEKPIDELRPGVRREEQDTGVRMALWSHDGKSLLTGASDGTIKSWGIFTSYEDAFQGDVARFNSGVMCGTWSPDHCKLLVGLAQGAVEILTSDLPDDDNEENTPHKDITFIPAARSQHPTEDDSGVAASKALIASQEIVMHPVYGAGQGPKYAGPYATYAHKVDAKGNYNLDKLCPEFAILQLDAETRKQARREGGPELKMAVKKADMRIYRNARTLAHVRNVEVLGKFVEEREVVSLGKRHRAKEEQVNRKDNKDRRRDGKERGRKEGRGEARGTAETKASSPYSGDESWEDPLEEDYWF